MTNCAQVGVVSITRHILYYLPPPPEISLQRLQLDTSNFVHELARCLVNLTAKAAESPSISTTQRVADASVDWRRPNVIAEDAWRQRLQQAARPSPTTRRKSSVRVRMQTIEIKGYYRISVKNLTV